MGADSPTPPQPSRHSPPPSVLLIGLRASGKTTIGRLLSSSLRRTLIDLDEQTSTALSGLAPGEVWRTLGEPAWRAAELESLRKVVQIDGRIIALGGGTLMIDDARRLIDPLRADGRALVCYLACDPDKLARRLRREPGDRPSLTGLPPDEEIRAVWAQRDPVYRSIADVVCDVTSKTAEEAAGAILRWLAQRSTTR